MVLNSDGVLKQTPLWSSTQALIVGD